MRRSLWIVGALSAGLLAGCAHNGGAADEAQLGRLPMDQKQVVLTARHNVEVARANQAAANTAKHEAEMFRDLADKEVNAGKADLERDNRYIHQAFMTNRPRATKQAQERANVALEEMEAARARKDYADRVVDLRHAQLALASDQVALANAELKLQRIDTLHSNGLPIHESLVGVRRERDEASARCARDEQTVAALSEQTERLRTAWTDRFRSYNVAARETPTAPMIPPRPPRRLSAEPLPTPQIEKNQPLPPRLQPAPTLPERKRAEPPIPERGIEDKANVPREQSQKMPSQNPGDESCPPGTMPR